MPNIQEIVPALYNVLPFVENGLQLLQHLENISEDELPGLIILDLNMPLVDGMKTLKELKSKQRYRNIPIVIFSTSRNPKEENEARELGAQVAWSKNEYRR